MKRDFKCSSSTSLSPLKSLSDLDQNYNMNLRKQTVSTNSWEINFLPRLSKLVPAKMPPVRISLSASSFVLALLARLLSVFGAIFVAFSPGFAVEGGAIKVTWIWALFLGSSSGFVVVLGGGRSSVALKRCRSRTLVPT